ncbi:hypothetical protein ACFONN_05680 [Dyella humi]|uniref:DUF2974 domain-containing protein n=1 Tax=Dyella humi TaxID=1770547 RepID=A0ABW8IHG1_9GAMM
MPLSHEQYAFLSSKIYDPIVAGSRIESDTHEYRVRYVSPPSGSGYRGAVVQDLATGQLIVTNKGTDPLDIHDIQTDLGMGTLGLPAQWPEASATLRWTMNYAHQNGIPLSNISVTGHSLGGTLAQLQAAAVDVHAETFNAYGAASMAQRLGLDVEAAQERVVNHRMYHDPVSAITKPIGRTVEYMDYADYQRHQHHIPSPLGEAGAVFGAHGIANFWDKMHNRAAPVLTHNYMMDWQHEQHRALEQLPPGMPPDMSLDRLLQQASTDSHQPRPLAANRSVDEIFDHLCNAMQGDDRQFMQALTQVGQTDYVQEFYAQVAERVTMEDRQIGLQTQLEQTQQQLQQQLTQTHTKVLGL